jgi:hypothetical protein
MLRTLMDFSTSNIPLFWYLTLGRKGVARGHCRPFQRAISTATAYEKGGESSSSNALTDNQENAIVNANQFTACSVMDL